MPKVALLLERVIAKILELNDTVGTSAVRLSHKLAPKDAPDFASPKDVLKALERGLKNGVLAKEGNKFFVAGRPPPQPPTVGIEEVVFGAGPAAARGHTLTMSYEGMLEDGTRFDTASNFKFVLGAGEVIKGWEQGLLGLRVGGTRRLTIPPELGYGKRGSPPEVPGGAVLLFRVTLLSLK